MSDINNVHDKFFKKNMSDKSTVRNMLQNYLPEQILNLINLDNMELEKDTMIEEELENVFSDLIYKVSLNGNEAYLYFLFEHKSYPYRKIALQLLKYIRAIWELKMKQGKKKKLPLIIPIVFYHGRVKWDIGLKLSDLLDDIPGELREYVPDFKYLLYDFSPYSDQEIMGNIELRIFLQLLRYIFADMDLLKEKFEYIFGLFEELIDKATAMEYFETVIRYIMNAREGIDLKELARIASRVSSERGEAIMTIAEKLRMEGRIETAKNLIKMGMEIDKIAKATEIDEEKLKLLKKEITH
ncbi:MAG: Rpn family recombination-promoting nuclease/putative transposase [Halanaerobiales bacterium]|nr:Rpn family recombination-promoting nuclease/putative transposase [Halanaerobiales bacterium]